MPTWNKELIAEGVLAPDLNDEIRANWAALEAAQTKEHLFSTGETPDSNQGHHRQGSARCFFQSTAPGTRINGDAFTSIDNGSVWMHSDNKKIYILTDYSVPTWTSIESITIATLLAAVRTFAEIITFSKAVVLSKAPTLTEGIVANDSYLQARNEAGDGNVDLIKAARNEADDADVAQIPDEARLASSAAPTEDTQLVNKKFVNDQIAANAEAAASICKGWGYYSASTGAPSKRASYNVTSVVRNSVGNYTITWDTDFASANYCVIVAGAERYNAQSIPCVAYQIAKAAGTYNFVYEDAGNAPRDPQYIDFVAFGAQ